MSASLKPYQQAYISLSVSRKILRFDGPFTLKSGRQSPYFFNAGLFCDGESISTIAQCYAQMIVDSGVEVDVILGPAYKVSGCRGCWCWQGVASEFPADDGDFRLIRASHWQLL